MGEIRKPRPVKLICGLLAAGSGRLERGEAALAERFGPVDLENETFPFDFTAYYVKELGEGILRRFLSFERLIDPGELAGIKLETNRLEDELSEEGKRAVNIDPGYLDLSKLVLATTKDATYRVYFGEGIYGQSTYYFRDGSYRPWEWTYADYRTQTAIYFFNRVREEYKQKNFRPRAHPVHPAPSSGCRP
jgi:hypothetical protein